MHHWYGCYSSTVRRDGCCVLSMALYHSSYYDDNWTSPTLVLDTSVQWILHTSCWYCSFLFSWLYRFNRQRGNVLFDVYIVGQPSKSPKQHTFGANPHYRYCIGQYIIENSPLWAILFSCVQSYASICDISRWRPKISRYSLILDIIIWHIESIRERFVDIFPSDKTTYRLRPWTTQDSSTIHPTHAHAWWCPSFTSLQLLQIR